MEHSPSLCQSIHAYDVNNNTFPDIFGLIRTRHLRVNSDTCSFPFGYVIQFGPVRRSDYCAQLSGLTGILMVTQWPILVIWINFNPGMENRSHPLYSVGWNYVSILSV